MPENPSVEILFNDLMSRINYWRQEADLSYAETIGVLDMIKMDLHAEATDAHRET